MRIAGPVYRFQQHLGAVARGEDVGPCRIRTGDELHSLCETINAALARVQLERSERGASPSEAEGRDDVEAEAA